MEWGPLAVVFGIEVAALLLDEILDEGWVCFIFISRARNVQCGLSVDIEGLPCQPSCTVV